MPSIFRPACLLGVFEPSSLLCGGRDLCSSRHRELNLSSPFPSSPWAGSALRSWPIRILEEKKADLVSMGRALIADPELPIKALQGRTDEILPCISCNRCIQSIRKGALQCAVNPETGREGTLRLQRTSRPKKVWVIGGGPAGMKAAEIAARRGHQVTLFEKQERLGGQFLLAAVPPKKQVLLELIDFLKRALDRLPVKVMMGRPFDLALLERERPEVVIVATGGKPFLPPIEGVREARRSNGGGSPCGSGSSRPESPHRWRRRNRRRGGRSTSPKLGKEVTLMEMREGIALDLVAHLQHFLNKRLDRKGGADSDLHKGRPI